MVVVMHGEMKRAAIQDALDLRHRDYFNEAYLIPALNAGYVEMTIPDKPKSSQQKYRLTKKGHLFRPIQFSPPSPIRFPATSRNIQQALVKKG